MQYESDYVLRLVEQMGGLVRQAFQMLATGSQERTFELAEEAIGLALDLDPQMTSRLAPQSLTALLELKNLDDRVLLLVADAFDALASALEQTGAFAEAELRHQQAGAVLKMLDPSRAN
ncbi:MAG: hypothetical protein FWE94_02030 [Coriobacteriia bacterium]|nr:hypothetical protein [Coriobacteriia bacterium]